MADEKSRDYRQELTDLIIRKLEEGAAPWQKPWKPGESGLFPHNPTTDKPYRGANALHLTLVAEIRNYNDPRWMTYKQAAEQGYQVRKGEKGTVVEYWKFHEERPVLDDQGQPVVDEETGKPKTVTYALDKPRVFRAVVFNAKQMDNVPEWKNEPKQFDWDPSERAEQIIRESGARIFHDQGDRAFYSPYKDEIHLPGRDQFASAEAYYGTALHELGHWTGHSSRLNRDLAHPFGSEGYAKEELRAELASYFMSHRLGIAHDTDRHAAYVKSWIKVLREDKNEIFRASRDAERITDFLMSPELAKNVDLARAQSQTLTVADLTAEQYRAMTAADEVFQRELVRVYGEDKASDARYQTMHEDPAVEKARKDYHAATEVWRNAVAQVRETLGVSQEGIKMDADGAIRPTVAGTLRHNDMPAMGDSGYRTFHREMVNERQESGEYYVLESQVKQLLGNEARFSALAMDDVSSIQGKVIAESKYAFVLQIGEKEAVSLHKIDFRRLPEIGQEVVVGGMDRDNPANGRFIQLVQPERQTERTTGEKTYLDVPYKEKNEAKALGARWDGATKRWYAPAGTDLEKLAKWLPKTQEQGPQVDPMTAFTEAARAAGLVIEGQPVVGKLTRVPVVDGRRGNRDGAYTLHLDGRPSGYIQNFRTDHAERWTHQGRRLSPEENQRLAEHAREVKAQRAEELKQQHTRLADWAEKKWSGLSLSPPDGQENGYLMRKHVKAFGVRFDGDNVVVPLRDIDGKIWSMQTIEPGEEGKKHLTKNARKEGTMHVIGDLEPGKDILVAEGYATAASLHMATGKTVIMAVDSGNLDAVVGQVKERYPTSPIYIMGDDDRFNPTKNVGAKKAMEAAEKHQVGWGLPKFQVDGKLVDFNDLHVREGLDAVRHQVEETIEKTLMDAKLLAKDKIQRELVNGGVTDIVEKTIGDNTRHSGPFVYVGAYHAAQSVGRNEVVFHQIAKMDQKPETGQDVTVQYQNGRAEIRARYQDRQRQTDRSPEIAA
ncbi:DUF1738 domain-containing protein [Methylocaldum sp. BRCS4]|nr:DUF1738 domain-containing protein [Methylocaldum sp. BRCS4]